MQLTRPMLMISSATVPDGLDTQVGQFGFQMSGGQKHRIAIARENLKSCFLMKQLVSAVDTQSARTVQAADQASIRRKNHLVVDIFHIRPVQNHQCTLIDKVEMLIPLSYPVALFLLLHYTIVLRNFPQDNMRRRIERWWCR